MKDPAGFRPLWLNAVLFACIGVTAEVFFTAAADLLGGIEAGNPDWRLAGKSYVWMVFAYACIPVLILLTNSLAGGRKWWLRLPVYAVLIIVFEFFFGGLLELATGHCPWKYTSGWHLMGWARLDYFPFWMVFGGLVEALYSAINPGFGKNN